MMQRNPDPQLGFTLMEILIVLLITAIAMLALGTFSLSVMDSSTGSRERLTAVHLAEQVIEEWQHSSTDYRPDIASDCSMSAGTSAPPYSDVACTPTSGVKVPFTISASVSDATAPLPNGAGNVAFATMSKQGFSNTPKLKLVTVSWSHKGKTKSIYLTHLTR